MFSLKKRCFWVYKCRIFLFLFFTLMDALAFDIDGWTNSARNGPVTAVQEPCLLMEVRGGKATSRFSSKELSKGSTTLYFTTMVISLKYQVYSY
jgi:hypothetical protein